jgi:signal transduction histidine kinase
MKLSKKLQAAILDVYEAFWGSLFHVDIEVYNEVLDDQYRLIGTTDKEVFFNKKDAASFLKATGEQLAGNIERRNSDIKIETVGNLILITEQFDAYVLIGNDWTFYGRTRVSTWMQQKTNGWKLVQQHFSFPDNKAEEGQTIGLEKIANENLELRDAIKRRTIELENKNRELEIEAALDKVRSRSLTMHNSNELKDVIAIVFEKLKELGLVFDGTGIFLFKDDVKDFVLWVANPVVISEPLLINLPHEKAIENSELFNSIANAVKTKQNIYNKTYSFEEKNKYYTYVAKNNPQLPADIAQLMLDMPGYTHTMIIENNSALVADSWLGKTLSIEEFNILKRVAKVFEQAYIRFLDLQKAEEQAKEAQIEAALERVRSKTMAMHDSNDVGDTVVAMFAEFVHLGISTNRCGIVIFDDHESAEVWTARTVTEGKAMLIIGKLDLKIYDLLSAAYRSWKDKKPIYQYELHGDELVRHYKAIKRSEHYPIEFDMNALPEKEFHSEFFFPEGAVFAFTSEPIADENSKIMKRFAGVFGQTYRRYLDLQKAEAQARESQIQLALERVRARTMAMQKSDELADVTTLLFTQVSNLGIKTWTTGFNIWSDDNNFYTDYITNPQGGFVEPYTIDASTAPVFRKMSEAKKRGDDFLVNYEEGEELEETYRQLSKAGEKQFKGLLESGFSFPIKQYEHVIFGAKVSLLFITYEPVPEAHDIFKRFGKVFEQTYTRFMDLQKAETQARESQIQLALERVRARTMAMYQSDELREVVALLFNQIKGLGFDAFMCSISLQDKATGGYREIVSSHTQAVLPHIYNVPYFDDPLIDKFIAAFDEGIAYKVFELGGTEKKKLDEKYFTLTDYRFIPEELKQMMLNTEHCSLCCAYMKHGCITAIGDHELSADHAEILQRFAKVFEQTYIRFLDLQKAEAQSREGQIQLALERVRARTMAMHKSEELAETSQVLFHQLMELGDLPDRISIGIADETNSVVNFWSTDQIGTQISNSFTARLNERTVISKQYKAWKEQNKSLVIDLSGDELKEWIQFAREEMGILVKDEFIKNRRVHTTAFFSHGWILVTTHEPQSTETVEILERFASVFNLTYRRFLDLRNAEALAREAIIEAALERVRAITMAMHNSEDVSVATATMFIELEKLGIENFRGGILNIKDNKTMDVWSVNKPADSDPHDPMGRGKTIRAAGEWDMTLHVWWKELYKGWINKDEFSYFILTGKEKENYIKILDARRDYIPGGIKELPDCHIQAYFFGEGAVWTFSLQPHSEEDKQVMKKIASVFSLTFRRYQDLKKAEAQAREAQIEAALERVRSRTMGMHRSEEIADITGKIFGELRSLDLVLNRVLIWIFNDADRYTTWWSSNSEVESKAECHRIDYNDQPVFLNYLQAWQSKTPVYQYTLEGDMKKEWEDHLFNNTELSNLPAAVKKGMSEEGTIFTTSAISDYGIMMVGSYEPLSNQNTDIIQRFGRVFQQSYTRYLDVQKAEAQAREAKIEAALERVRSRSMAMQKSAELIKVVKAVREKLRELEVVKETNAVTIITFIEGSKDTDHWVSNPDLSIMDGCYHVPYIDLTPSREVFAAKEKGIDFLSMNLTIEQKNAFWKIAFERSDFKKFPDDLKKFVLESTFFDYYFAIAKNSVIGITSQTGILLSEKEKEILKRFARVFEQTYTRFLDLQKAEAQALEAIKRASVDRVRAEIASMRTTNDLERITPLIWNELTTLGVPFIRCGVFIMDEEKQEVQTYLYTEGKSIASFTSSFSNSDLIREALPYWQKKEVYKTHWDEAAFLRQAKALVEQGAIITGEKYLTENRPTDLYLHFLPFVQGMLYVGDSALLNEEHLNLVQALAEAFSTAYARYEDFNKLEAAKKQVDNTLNELQATQKQLIQSEKMASLGELTAGIAHEIQNPLNFVNNFSEVNKELLAELNGEIEKGNYEEAKIIAADIISNEDKISHHGKRADSIVKGMLQHSRSTSTIKEPADINALADEYLRLAYHGLRAKDKAFNATMKTDYDETIGKINIIPQDIGRVILNVITNAFYTVNEKRKALGDGYEPAVSLITKKTRDNVEITVVDNGDGISQKVVDKIFQPFFTTKPTGQGTGLGLSLAYDIVKTHGGDIKVESKEGEGSEFIIHLPIT